MPAKHSWPAAETYHQAARARIRHSANAICPDQTWRGRARPYSDRKSGLFLRLEFFPDYLLATSRAGKGIADRFRQKASLNIIVYASALITLAHFRAV